MDIPWFLIALDLIAMELNVRAYEKKGKRANKAWAVLMGALALFMCIEHMSIIISGK